MKRKQAPRKASNKRSSKKNANKVKARNSFAQPAKNVMIAQVDSMVNKACAITNPFCPAAWGARWPDNSMTKSVGWSGRSFQAHVADANGNIGYMFLPGLYDQGRAPVVPVAEPADFGIASAYGNLFTPPADIARWRITSWGIKIRSTAPKLSAQGMLRIRLFSPQVYDTLVTASLESFYADSSHDIPLSRLIDHDVYVLSMPLGTDARLFRDDQFDITAGGGLLDRRNVGWQVITIKLSGGTPSVQQLETEVFYNYEFVFADGSSSYAFAKSAPKDDPVARGANASVFEKIGNFVDGSASVVDRITKSAAVKYLVGGAVGYFTKSPQAALTAGSMVQSIQNGEVN
jgi:hypothetical protein